jgi:hypothetical protein
LYETSGNKTAKSVQINILYLYNKHQFPLLSRKQRRCARRDSRNDWRNAHNLACAHDGSIGFEEQGRGCGCSGSPYLEELESLAVSGDDVDVLVAARQEIVLQ